MQHHRQAKIALLIAGMCVTFVVAGLSTQLVRQSPLTVNGWVGHTQRVYREIQALLIAVLDAESGQRGFIITGNDAYLKTYVGAKARTDQHLSKLAQLTRDDPVQQHRVGELQIVIDRKFKDLTETIKAREKGGQQAAIAAVNSHVGLKRMDEARAIVLRMMEEEDKLLVVRNGNAYTLFYAILFCLNVIIVRDLIFVALWRQERGR